MDKPPADRLNAALAALEADDCCPSLVSVLTSSDDAVQRGRTHLAQHSPEYPDLDLVAFGSLGRLELTAASDLDHLIIFHGDPTATSKGEYVARLLPELRSVLGNGVELAPPGPTGLFGTEVTRTGICGVIGLQEDSNHNLSRRILFLEESVSLWRPELHRALMQDLFERYLSFKGNGDQVPRFLVNDIVRYWRTLAVDYQAKSPNSYSLRYVKLLISRKFTFAASVLPVLLAPQTLSQSSQDTLSSHLTEIFLAPPLVRFAEAVASTLRDDPGAMSYARDTLRAMDEGVQLLGDPQWREDVRLAASGEDPKGTDAFQRALSITTSLQSSLTELFMTPTMTPLTRDYMLF